jgi:ADP-ribosylation factor family
LPFEDEFHDSEWQVQGKESSQHKHAQIKQNKNQKSCKQINSTMGLSFSMLLDQLFWGTEEYRLLCLGLDAAGKTTIVYVFVICVCFPFDSTL